MAYKDKKKKQEYDKKYYEAHKEECNARSKAWNQAHKEEHNASSKAWNQAHKEEHNASSKAWCQAHKEDKMAYEKSDVNSAGRTKGSIRDSSRKYLHKTLGFQKLDGYERHHCFGYENFKEFIYIPKWLHISIIHPFLRKNNIDADSNHFELIRPLLDSCKEKIYIIKDGKITEYN